MRLVATPWVGLQSTGGGMILPEVHARRSGTTQPLANQTRTTILYNTVDLDTTASYNPATGVFTAPATGLYAISATTGVQNAGTATSWSLIRVQLIHNGIVAFQGAGHWQTMAAGAINWQSVSHLMRLNAGDTVRVDSINDQVGGTLSTLFGGRETVLAIACLRLG